MKKVHYTIVVLFCLTISLYIVNPSCADISIGMVGYWKFNEEVGGTVTDSNDPGGNGNNGTLKGSTLPQWTTDIATGRNSLQFDGVDSYVEIPFHPSLDLTNNFTVSMWFQGDGGWMISKGVYCSDPRAWSLSTKYSKFQVDYSVNGSSMDYVRSIKNIFYTNNKNDWHHAVFVYTNIENEGSALLYLDGDLTDSIYIGQDMYSNNQPVYIGRYHCAQPNSTYAYAGGIDEVRLYDRDLDSQDVLELYIAEKYNSGIPLTDSNAPLTPAPISVENMYATRVDISWPVSIDIETAVKQYDIYRDGEHIATHLSSEGAATEYYSDLINVKPSTTYSYTVSAVDTAGNESSQSTPINTTTPSLVDIPVFPGAEGFGTTTTAGSGRHMASFQTTVYKVTTLEDTFSYLPPISGSLRECVQETGPRVCVFETSGTIELANTLSVTNPYITIAGQTAPSPGITLSKDVFGIRTHDVLVRHIRVRSGDNPPGTPEHRDALAIAGDDVGSIPIYNVVVDHCSFSWAMDETVQFWYPGIHDVTVSNSISSEALHDSLHQKGPHSMGFLVGPYSKDISINRNLLAHNNGRNPLISHETRTHVINNLIYNPGGSNVISLSNSLNPGEYMSSIIGNEVILGDNTNKDLTFSAAVGSNVNNESLIFVLDNGCDGELQNDPWSCVFNRKGESIKSPLPPVPSNPAYVEWPSPLTILPVNEVEEHIINNVGARPADRGPVDTRIIDEVINREGYIIDCVEEGTIYHPDGLALEASTNTITLDDDASDYNDRYNGQIIEITGGTGNGQSREISDYVIVKSGDEITARIATVSQAWDTLLNTTSQYRIENICDNGAPEGWTPLDINTRALTLPADKDNDDDGDGYTNLEEWLHLYADSVEGNLVCTDNDQDGHSVEGAACGPVDWDDSDSTVYPGAPEILGDGKDNDQDGLIDEIISWAGAMSSDWDTADNWDLAVVPQTSDNVIITAAAYEPELASAVTINNLTIESGKLTLDSYDLTIGLVVE